MQEKQLMETEAYTKKNKRRQIWKMIVRSLACIVVFCTTYALILPAITQERDVYCGMEEHEHTDTCYKQLPVEDILVCEVPEIVVHEHTDACYVSVMETEAQTSAQIEESIAVHEHEASCYEMVRGELECGMEETEGHQHGEDCFVSEELICEREEVPAHLHGDACYATMEVLVCDLPEGEVVSEETTEAAETQAEEEETRVLICTEPEEMVHVHEGACFQPGEQPLTCALAEDENHTHTTMCYGTWELICEKEVHNHELACYSDKTADVETEDDWIKSFGAAVLTGDFEDDVLAIAKTQLGYMESTKNYIVMEDGETVKGYTRYGAWYGDSYGDWCAMFASFCLEYAGAEGMPLECNCQKWIDTLSSEEYGLYRPAGGYDPQPGDLIFFDWEENGESDHVGIVVEVTEDADQESMKLKVIEGNADDRVQFVMYEPDDSDIMGYAVIPDKQGRVKTTLTASIYTDGTYRQQAEDDTVISVSGELPVGAQVKAFPVEMQQNDLEALCVYDIEIVLSDGTVYQHEGDPLVVNFSSTMLDVLCRGLIEPEVFFIPEEGEPEPMEAVIEDGGVRFETPHFSTYALVVRGAAVTVANREELIAAWDAAVHAGGMIQLTADVEMSQTLALRQNVEIVLDLNGNRLTHTGSASLFSVQAGTLTVGDSAQEAETVTKVADITVDSLGAHVATATEENGKVTLEYYVTESEQIEGTVSGDTMETLYLHRVTGTGSILAKAAGQPLFMVTNGTLNIESGMYYGGDGRAIYQTGGTTNLNGGYICGFTGNAIQNPNITSYDDIKKEFGGAIWADNANIFLTGTVLAGNQAASGGAIYVEDSTIEISGGIISGNVSTMTGNNEKNNEGLVHYGGGGIFALRGTGIVMSGGYITNNLAKSVCYFDGGGGVLICGNNRESTMTVSGGYLTGNEAASGGAIRTNWANGVQVTISGGYFCANYARSAEGGAVSVNMNAKGVIVGGFFNNNRTDNKTHWGGGAIFGANGGNLYMLNVLVTGNEAGGFGGGIAGCSTGRVQILVEQGGAVYNNTAAGENASGDGTSKNEDRVYAYNDPMFMSHGYADFFCALNSTVEGSMLGGYTANWQGSSDGKPVIVPSDGLLQSAYIAGLTANPSDEGIEAARELARVFVNGNYSYTHGGGILANGYLMIGDTEEVTLSSRIELTGSKAFVDGAGNYLTTDLGAFLFAITDAYTGELIANGTNDEDGNIEFNRRLAYNRPGTYTYLIREVPQENEVITYDTTVYRMTVTVETETDTIYNGITGKTDITRNWHKLTRVVIEKKIGNDWIQLSNYDPGNNESGEVKVSLTGGATFTNLLLEYTDVTVVKKWEGEVTNSFVTVHLYRNGTLHDTKRLSAANNWRYTWENLPVYEKNENGEVLAEYVYSVEEEPVDGYYSDYEITNNVQIEDYWIPIRHVSETLIEGQRYLITYRDSKNNDWVLNVVASENQWLTSADKVSTQRGDSSITYKGEQIKTYFPASAIGDRSVFRAMKENKTHAGNEGIKLYNMGSANALLVEKNGDSFLKVPSYWGRDNGWVSLFTYDGEKLYGHYQGTLDGTYTMIYEESSGKFDADPNEVLRDIAQVYTLVTAGAAGETVYTITNYPVEQITYELNITKVSGWDPDVKLAGAVFNLTDAEGNVLKFRKEAEGAYVASAAEDATDSLVTNSGGKLVLKKLPPGEYILKEIQAPNGYMLTEDTPVTLGGEEQLSLAITIKDPPVGVYELPETGGAGTNLYTMAGLLLITISAAYLMYNNYLRRREEFNILPEAKSKSVLKNCRKDKKGVSL